MTRDPQRSIATHLRMLDAPRAPVHMVIDTDADNEIDDQFALAYALRSPEHMTVEAIYAAPYHNARSSGPADGMRRSYDEIVRVVRRLNLPPDGLVFAGAEEWLSTTEHPRSSPAVDDMIARARKQRGSPLYVVAIGAITNVATALLLAPDIIDTIVVVWLGGNPHTWHRATEFNAEQDLRASRLLFDSGVPLVQVPCVNVAEHLRTTEAEIERYLRGHGGIADYLCDSYAAVYDDHFGRARSLWDVAPIAWFVNPAWVETTLIHSPILTNELTWSIDSSRHLIRAARSVDRDAIFGDLFRKLRG